MPPKQSTSGTSDGNKTQIIVAVISLIGTLGVAYFGYLQVMAPQRLATNVTQTAEARSTTIPTTNASVPTLNPTDTVTPTKELIASPTTPIISSPTPQPLITTNCLFSSIWNYYPRLVEPTDAGCWKVPDFTPATNSVEMARITGLGAGEQQRGFYALLNGATDIRFTVKIHALDEQTISSDLTKVSNIAFGIVEGSSFNYSGVYLFYYASKPGSGRYKSQITREQSPTYTGSLDIEREQSIRFLMQGNRLSVYIDDIPVGRPYILTYKQNAFYFGYRLLDNTELSTSISNLSFGASK